MVVLKRLSEREEGSFIGSSSRALILYRIVSPGGPFAIVIDSTLFGFFN
jgi:hypothetical protein